MVRVLEVRLSLSGTASPRSNMKLDNDKIDDAVLALLLLGLHDDDRGWKGFDWESMNRLHEKGYISDPRGKAKSIVLTEEGFRQGERLLARLFSEHAGASARKPSQHVYAVVRFDASMSAPENSFTVKEIVGTQAIAESEVKRLNEVNADKHCTYFWQTTRWFPSGTSAGNRKVSLIGDARAELGPDRPADSPRRPKRGR